LTHYSTRRRGLLTSAIPQSRKSWNGSSASSWKRIAKAVSVDRGEVRKDLQRLQSGSTPVATREATPKVRDRFRRDALRRRILLLATTRKTVLTDKDVLVLADFVNTTGDSVFDGTLPKGSRFNSSNRLS
jgi:hypothetical protein